MSEGLETLRGIGVEKIHERTHISRQHVESVLNGVYDNLRKIHFFGFISICEREYELDLSDLRADAEAFYGEALPAPADKEKLKVFVSADKQKNFIFLYIAIAILVFVMAILFTIISSSSPAQVEVHPIDNSAIESAKENIAKYTTIEDENTTIEEEDENITTSISDKVVEVEKSFKIIPNVRLWLGYIDLSTYKKRQQSKKSELILDPDKEWLILLGHGNVKIEINGEMVEFRGGKKIRLYYKDSLLTNITAQEFKDLNRGKGW